MAGKIRKTAGILLLIAAIVFSQIPSENVSAKNVDFQMNGSTLVKYTGNDEDVTIPDNVEIIGEEAFYENNSIKRIVIPESVAEIRHHAFYGCNNLEEVIIADSVVTIGNAAFAECDQLKDVSFGASVKEMGNGVFSGCPLLSEIAISKENPYLICEAGVLMNADETHLYEMLNGCITTAYEMPDTVESISKYAFWGCDNVEYVELSAALSEISPYAFSNCRGLQAITIPYSVTKIGAKAFENCSNLKAVEIPETVKSIDDTAFDGCGNLQIKAATGSVADSYASTHIVSGISQAEYEEIRDAILEQAVVQEDSDPEEENSKDAGDTRADGDAEVDGNVEADGDAGADGEDGNGNTSINTGYYDPVQYAEEDVLGQTIIVSGNAVVFIDNTNQSVYQGGQDTSAISGENVEQSVNADVEGIQPNFQEETVDSFDEQMPEGIRAEKGFYIPKYTIVGGTVIANQAYYNRTDLTEYEFPENIEEIGDFAFARSGLQRVVIPEGTTQIGYGAFYHCDQLTDVEIPGTVTEIEPYAFANTPWLDAWMQGSGSDYLIVGDGILLAYRGSDSKIQIPDGVRVIAPNCFEGHSGIITVTLPSSVTEIGEEAFLGCANLANVNGGTGVVKIADRAFYGCPIATIKIGKNVMQIGMKAFDMTDTIRSDTLVAVDFKGDVLPQISYEASTTRLYHAKDRGYCFEGVEAAVIQDEQIELEGTVLDPYVSGFRGFICTWDQDAPEGEEALVIVKCTVPVQNPEEIVLPEQIRLYGTTYPVSGAAENAYSYYEDTGWMPEESEEPAVSLTVQSTVLPGYEYSGAKLSGNQESIFVELTDDADAEEKIRQAYENYYGPSENMRLYGFDITAQTGSGIPLTGFGTNALEITVAISEDMSEALTYVMCLDENGQLEIVDSETLEIGGVPCLRFSVNHLSPYGICSFETDEASESNSTGKLDDSPDTGDPINPRTVLCIGMGALSILLLLWKQPKKKYYAGKR